ncbi:MAG: hypothetical protein VYB18_02610 [Thermodesulfobacteriota bacterium]|nr:hypothetical protein [Thermodesulfobacteriota bacterium]
MAHKSNKISFGQNERFVFFVTIVGLIYSIISNSYFDTNGFLTSDSTHFLKLAQSLRDKNGLDIYSWTNSGDKQFFSTWPIGYPTLIYLVSNISQLDVFWSSKMANIICAILIIFSVRRYLKVGFSIIGIIFLSGSFLNIFSYTSTETLFALGLVLYILRVCELENNQSKKNLLYVCLAFVLTFTSRYIGAYLLIFNLLLILRVFRDQQRYSKYLLVLLIFSSLYVLGYLLMNKIASGYITYSHAYMTYESWQTISVQFIKKIFEEMNLVMASVRFGENSIVATISSILSLYLAYLLFAYLSKKKTLDSTLNNIANNFLYSGFLYLAIVFVWRLIIWFSPFSYRILFPSTLLIALGLLFKLLSKNDTSSQEFKKIYLALCAIAIFSFSFNIVYKQFSFEGVNYNQKVEEIAKKYREIKPGSVVIFGERHLDYLRQDIIPIKPYYLPLFSKIETKEELNRRIKRFKRIYFNIPSFCQKPYDTLSGDRGLDCLSENKRIHSFDKDIIGFIKENSTKGVFEVRQIR